MQINGYELNLTNEELETIVSQKMRKIELIDQNFEAYQALKEADKKALFHLLKAADIIDDVALEQDHPLNRSMKQALKKAAETSEYAKNAYTLFQSFNGVAGLNGIDPKPVQIFKGIKPYIGKNFYPIDLSVEEFHQILLRMFESDQIDEIKHILSARTMVRRSGSFLKAIDYTVYFEQEFSELANELELAAHYTTEPEMKDYLSWQVQAFLQNNEDMDMLADKHWAILQNNRLEFTVSRENYEDEMTPTVLDNKNLKDLIELHHIEVVAKDTLGCRVGLVNDKGTELILNSKKTLPYLALLMPYHEKYTQKIEKDMKQTMVDVDLMALKGDYAFARGGITTAQNLPNNDKIAVKTGGGRRNVYHRQVRFSYDKERIQKLLDLTVAPEFHPFFDEAMRHHFVIGHENGHSLGPNSSYQTALGIYAHIIEELKADVVSVAFLNKIAEEFQTYSTFEVKQIYTTWAVGLFLRAKPVLSKPHRMADLIQFNYALHHKAIFFDENEKMHIRFEKIAPVMYRLLEETIETQLSKSPETAKKFIDRWGNWSEISEHIASVQKGLGIKPYIQIVTHF